MPSGSDNVGFQGVKRKRCGHRRTVAIDPEPTSQRKVYAIFRARPFPISDDYDIISAAVGSTREGDARGLAGLRIAETKQPDSGNNWGIGAGRIAMLTTDYLIIGSGTAGMSFADQLLTDTNATIGIIDRHHMPAATGTTPIPLSGCISHLRSMAWDRVNSAATASTYPASIGVTMNWPPARRSSAISTG